MYRSKRETGDWFDKDKKGGLRDRSLNISIGPGKYNTSEQVLSDKTKMISWNTGSVPFGVSNNGRKDVFRTARNHSPGPGAYEVGEPIHDYQGVYKNMGKKKQKKEKKKDQGENEQSEEVEEVEKDSEGSENDEQEKMDLVPDADGDVQEAPEEDKGKKHVYIPGYS